MHARDIEDSYSREGSTEVQGLPAALGRDIYEKKEGEQDDSWGFFLCSNLNSTVESKF